MSIFGKRQNLFAMCDEWIHFRYSNRKFFFFLDENEKRAHTSTKFHVSQSQICKVEFQVKRALMCFKYCYLLCKYWISECSNGYGKHYNIFNSQKWKRNFCKWNNSEKVVRWLSCLLLLFPYSLYLTLPFWMTLILAENEKYFVFAANISIWIFIKYLTYWNCQAMEIALNLWIVLLMEKQWKTWH